MDLRTLILALFAFCATFAGGWWFGLGPKTFGAFGGTPGKPVASAVQQGTPQQQSTAPRVLVVVPTTSQAAARSPQGSVGSAAARSSKRFRLKRR